MLLEEKYCKLVTMNTHLGLFRYCRLPFGIASTPAIFQCPMDTLLQDISHVICYIDDVLVTGLIEEVHLQNLTQVLQKLQEQRMRLKKEKCAFSKRKWNIWDTRLMLMVFTLHHQSYRQYSRPQHQEMSQSYELSLDC